MPNFDEYCDESRALFQRQNFHSHPLACWEIILPILKSICSTHRDLLIDRNYFLELNGFGLNGLEDRNLCRVIERVEGGGSQAAIDTMEFMINSKVNWCGTLDLKELLAHSRYCNTSDTRDKVFAFTGLADPAYNILSDYSHSIAQVLTDTTAKIIQFEVSLNVLCHVAASRPRHTSLLPSWVVDWTAKEQSDHHRNNHYGTKFWITHTGLSCKNATASFHIVRTENRDVLALQVRGVFIDKLVTESVSGLDSIRQRALFSSFRSFGGFEVRGSSLLRHNDELWILDGCGAPLILRTQPGCRYQLVSAALVFMPGGEKSFVDQLKQLVVAAAASTRLQEGGHGFTFYGLHEQFYHAHWKMADSFLS
ncbi:hypothetical protein DM02DRAFT_663878 [Periconia macrospinosa]|uniref:Heterokaryon incompatibility domain-containing protein n=1 Tax=Periconia macrospinosa TaxID=97972 RepID=A0A2V1D0H8_9PLEO|nr:hypothetical protein DM02DRAFT_663878 [Periconia macrospinosa]